MLSRRKMLILPNNYTLSEKNHLEHRQRDTTHSPRTAHAIHAKFKVSSMYMEQMEQEDEHTHLHFV